MNIVTTYATDRDGETVQERIAYLKNLYNQLSAIEDDTRQQANKVKEEIKKLKVNECSDDDL